MNELKFLLELTLLFGSAGGIIWRIAKSESKIYDAIDSLKDTMNERFNQLESSVRLNRAAVESKFQMQEYKTEVIESKLTERIIRVKAILSQVTAYMEKHSAFMCRGGSCEIDSQG